MLGSRVVRMALLAGAAGFVMAVEYRARGVQPLFNALLVAIALWTGCCLWGDPGDGGGA